MKKLFALFIASAISIGASGATLVPIQLLNPAGSISGQAIVSTGASSAPAWTNVLTSGTFTGATLSGQTQATNTASGAAIIRMTGNGATTPNKYLGVLNGFFTIYNSAGSGQVFNVDDSGNVLAQGSIQPSSTGGIVGTTTNNNANAGSVGEYLSASGGPTSLATTTSTSVGSINLTPGDWDVQAVASYSSSATTLSQAYVGVSTVLNTLGALGSYTELQFPGGGTTALQVMTSPVVRVSVSISTLVYATGNVAFSSGTLTMTTALRARRVR